MSMLERLCDAFKQAIVEYEAEMKGKVPLKRQAIIAELRTLLEDYQQDECCRMIWLSDQESVPNLSEIDKSVIYLTEEKDHIHVYWYTHGLIEKAVTKDKNQCKEIKNVFHPVATVEKLDSPALFNDLTLLCGYRNRKRDSLLLRTHMMAYLSTMPVSRFAFISLASRLQRKLQMVLEQPNFSEFQLSVAERAEITGRQQMQETEIRSLKAQVSLLQASLREEQAKDNVQQVNELSLALSQEKKNTAFLTQENKRLQQSVDKLFSECSQLKTTNQTLSEEKKALQADNDDLKAKYQALMQEKASQEQPQQKTGKSFWG